MNGITEYIVRETNYQDATKQEVIGELVRCKDCRYWQDQAEGVVEVPVCEYDFRNGKIGITQIMGAEDYCSHGERKTAESE